MRPRPKTLWQLNRAPFRRLARAYGTCVNLEYALRTLIVKATTEVKLILQDAAAVPRHTSGQVGPEHPLIPGAVVELHLCQIGDSANFPMLSTRDEDVVIPVSSEAWTPARCLQHLPLCHDRNSSAAAALGSWVVRGELERNVRQVAHCEELVDFEAVQLGIVVADQHADELTLHVVDFILFKQTEEGHFSRHSAVLQKLSVAPACRTSSASGRPRLDENSERVHRQLKPDLHAAYRYGVEKAVKSLQLDCGSLVEKAERFCDDAVGAPDLLAARFSRVRAENAQFLGFLYVHHL